MVAYCIASIEENVGENLLQVVKVPANLRLRDIADMDRDLFRFEEILMKRHRGGDQRRDANRFACPRTVGDQVEQIVDQRRGAERLLLHFFQEPVFRIVRRNVLQQELRIRGNAGERRVDFVRHAGGK